MKILRGIVAALALLGLLVIATVVLVAGFVVFACLGAALGYAWFDSPVGGAIAGVLVALAYTIVHLRRPLNEIRRAIPDYVRNLILQRDEYCCRFCGSTQHLQIDHIRPVALGGDNSIDNLQVLCEHCNKSKGARFIG